MADGMDGRATTPIPDFRWDGADVLLRHLREGPMARLSALLDAPDPDGEAILALAAEIDGVLTGLRLYQRHPYHPLVPPVPIFHASGSTRVLDYGGDGPPILVVPSMINRASVLDLTPEESRMRWLAANGLRAFLVDWGDPDGGEARFRIGDYLSERLIPALDAVAARTGGPVHLAGYCMGGPIALALAAARPEATGRAVTLGTPWDFAHFPEHETYTANRKALEAALMTMGALYGAIPPQVAASFFAMRDPAAAARKFRRFAAGDPHDPASLRFIAIEDWLNDGRAVPLPVALECFSDWLVGNALVEGTWQVGARAFDAGAVRAPVMVVAGTSDSVVPPSSALPLAGAVGAARVLEPKTGHLGIVLGEKADREVWGPIREFLLAGADGAR